MPPKTKKVSSSEDEDNSSEDNSSSNDEKENDYVEEDGDVNIEASSGSSSEEDEDDDDDEIKITTIQSKIKKLDVSDNLKSYLLKNYGLLNNALLYEIISSEEIINMKNDLDEKFLDNILAEKNIFNSILMMSDYNKYMKNDFLLCTRNILTVIGRDGKYPCKKCGSKNTVTTSAQTRSADEAATDYTFCNDCKHLTKRN